MTAVRQSLECPICGDPAITSETGWFYEDEGEACASCEAPGHVEIDEDNAGREYAYWSADEDGPS